MHGCLFDTCMHACVKEDGEVTDREVRDSKETRGTETDRERDNNQRQIE